MLGVTAAFSKATGYRALWTAVAKGSVEAFVLPRHRIAQLAPEVRAALQAVADFRTACARVGAARTEQDLALLEREVHGVGFFQKLPRHIHGQVLRVMTYERLMQGVELFHEGDVGETFYVILSGAVDVVKMLPGKNPDGSDSSTKEEKARI